MGGGGGGGGGVCGGGDTATYKGEAPWSLAKVAEAEWEWRDRR